MRKLLKKLSSNQIHLLLTQKKENLYLNIGANITTLHYHYTRHIICTLLKNILIRLNLKKNLKKNLLRLTMTMMNCVCFFYRHITVTVPHNVIKDSLISSHIVPDRNQQLSQNIVL